MEDMVSEFNIQIRPKKNSVNPVGHTAQTMTEAEAFAIEAAVFQLTSVFSLYPEKTQNIVIFSDSKSVLEALQNESLQNSSLKSLFLTIDCFLKTYDVDLTL
ncbi:hypothetical protein ElyMa_004574500 [Elysia marginata]|uniref:RNase H type-1 domain-containing protein n=1 Tax=Elysia marginata TaxID=1093978 RepID=A0AAV4HUQ5_9GAST|nr:hypothetical protein ElyMa_004574500 [Elysia marginata]